MGLSAKAFSGLCKLDHAISSERCIGPVDVTDFSWPDGEIEDNSIYSFTDRFDLTGFSYSGYGCWRNDLAKLAGYESSLEAWNHSEGPFWELICFSDCEGVIGPETSKKLAKDFADFEKKASEFVSPGWEPTFFYNRYMEWKKAFEMASQNGMVLF